MKNLAYVYGSHLPFRLLIERNLAYQEQRLGGLPSSYLALDILTGRDEELPFPNYQNDIDSMDDLAAPMNLDNL